MWSLPQSEMGSQQSPTKRNVTATAQPCHFTAAICCLHPPKVANKSRAISIWPEPSSSWTEWGSYFWDTEFFLSLLYSTFPRPSASLGRIIPSEEVLEFGASQGLSYAGKVWAFLPQTEDTLWLGSLNSQTQSFYHGKVVFNALHCHNLPACPWTSQFPSVKWGEITLPYLPGELWRWKALKSSWHLEGLQLESPR